jgi:chemotaxis protein MotB
MNARKTQRSSRRRAEQQESSASHDRWLISYADLMTLLLALFIVLYAASDHQRATKIATAMAAQFNDRKAATVPSATIGIQPASEPLVVARTALDKAFAANRTLRDRARINMTERGLIVSLTEAGFFAPADATVRGDALPLIDALSDALRQSNVPLRVEGHTDSLPISTARYPSNWELSAARASVVLARLVDRGIPPSRLSVAGFAGERPVADNSTPEGRALNRRVDLVILKPSE